MKEATVSEVMERFMRYVIPVPESGCWLWQGQWNDAGYGRFVLNGRREMAHRVAYEMLREPIPQGMQIDHLCRVHCCVNPDHLDVVTSRENTLRGISPPAVLAKKTVCKRGHPLTGDNVVSWEPGSRCCRTCHRIRLDRERAERTRKRAALTPAGGEGQRNETMGSAMDTLPATPCGN